ncbi:hypothetical protein F5148DRAFT_113471 [Russula earlei]|uniref:Uncharacterized protein n=1 Tax=Russula earlei TaxID=71964 RepID=A0ACC0TQY7_9AGAM|nr:hypothetical protein F5148DRAFT_113471 [Russula earlei]
MKCHDIFWVPCSLPLSCPPSFPGISCRSQMCHGRKNMFKDVVNLSRETDMYEPFVNAITPHLSKLQLYDTSKSEEKGKTDFPFKIKPDCSVYSREHPYHGTDSSIIELFIEFKRDDPFINSSNITPDGFLKKAHNPRLACGQIIAYAASHMSAQYRTHIFSVLICSDYARLIRWDRSGAIVTEPMYYDTAPELLEFFILFDRSSPQERGWDTTVRLANSEDTRVAVEAVKELRGLTPLLVITIPNSVTGEAPEYVIAPPLALPWIPVGRWTRTSIGYDVQRKRSIFMKDSWRPVIAGVPREGDVYSRFKANAVRNVPHCSNSADIGYDKYHSTQTDHFTRDPNGPIKPHRHYRLILDDIGQPLNSFDCSREMVRAVYAALIAHESAYRCGFLHRDISARNILITHDDKFDGGLLIDWDLCRDMNSQVDGPRRAARAGTWQFMAADLVKDPTINHTLVHDLESTFYVVFWISIRFLRNSWTPEERGVVMNDLFNPPAFSTVGSASKRNWMSKGDTNDFKILDNRPLTGLIHSLLPFFKARYLGIGNQPTDDLNFGPPRSELPELRVNEEDIQRYLRLLVDHQEVMSIFRKSLEIQWPKWPEVEHAEKQKISYLGRENRFSSKRSTSRSSLRQNGEKEGSSEKRLRPA